MALLLVSSNIITTDDKEIDCLATAIHYEANGEEIAGKEAVGNVIMNRVKSQKFPNSACKVISQKGQFPWYRNQHRYSKEILELAHKIFYNTLPDNTSGALFFHNIREHPKWKKLEKIKRIGKHEFYRFRI